MNARRAFIERLLARFDGTAGHRHLRVLRGLLLVGGFTLVGKLAGAAREMAIAWRYGIGATVDVYAAALLVIGWLPSLVASLVTAVLVPLERGLAEADRRQFGRELLGGAVLLAIALAIVIALFVAPQAATLADGFTPRAGAALTRMLTVLAPASGLMLLSAVLAARLLARERHANTLLEAVPALVVLVAVIVWVSDDPFRPLLVGIALGATLHVVALLVLLSYIGERPRLALPFRHPAWTSLGRAAATLAIGTLLIGLVPMLDLILAARLEPGAVATLGYAQRLLALALGLAATSAARALLPVLSDADASVAERVALARRWWMLLVGLAVPTMLLGLALAPMLVTWLFERGAFTVVHTERVVSAFRVGLLQLPVYVGGVVMVQLCASLGRFGWIAWSSALALTVKLASGIALADRFGVEGILASTALMYLATCAYFLWRTSRLARRDTV